MKFLYTFFFFFFSRVVGFKVYILLFFAAHALLVMLPIYSSQFIPSVFIHAHTLIIRFSVMVTDMPFHSIIEPRPEMT